MEVDVDGGTNKGRSSERPITVVTMVATEWVPRSAKWRNGRLGIALPVGRLRRPR